MMDSSAWFQVRRFCRQYLQLERTLDYPAPVYLQTASVQSEITKTILGTSHPGSPSRYRLRVLKELVSRIESSIDDWEEYGIDENLVEAIGKLMAMPLPKESDEVQKRSYVTYFTDNEPITLFENRSLISQGGTTGLRTWEAALHLGEYLVKNCGDVAGKAVLELGAGTGYLSILARKYLGATKVAATDGSDEVINALLENFYLNGLQDEEHKTLVPAELMWGHSIENPKDTSWGQAGPFDTVIGADITYDQRIIPSLVATITKLRDKYPEIKVIISATQRNEETFQVFVEVCKEAGFKVDFVDFKGTEMEKQVGPFYNTIVPIHIVRLE